MQTPGKAYFDALYAKEDPWGERRSAREMDRVALIQAQFYGRQFTNGLDIGCGEGYLLSTFNFVRRKVGVDISPAALTRARVRHPGIAFIEGDLRALNLPGGYDFISCMEALYYLQDDAEREAAVASIASLGSRDCTYLFSLVTRGDPKYRRYFSVDEARALLDRHFKIVHAFALSLRGRMAYRILPRRVRLDLLSYTPLDRAYQCAFVCHGTVTPVKVPGAPAVVHSSANGETPVVE